MENTVRVCAGSSFCSMLAAWRRVAIAMCAAVAFGAALAETVRDGYNVHTDEDVSYVDAGFAVPANAALTVRPGVFYPQGGPLNVDEVVWKNVKLTDIASFTGKISAGSGDACYWAEAGCYNVVTNTDEGYVQCQLQMKGTTTLYGFVMQYRQEGRDVKARIVSARYYAKSDNDPGVDLTANGDNLDAVTNTLYGVDYRVRAIADLGYVLRDGAETSAAPTEIVLKSTDAVLPDEETYSYLPCLTNEHVLIARNLRICDIVGISGEISSKDYVNDVTWTSVAGHCLTNIDDAVQMNLVCHVEENKRRVGASIRFYQDGADIKCCTYWGGHKWDGSEVSLDEPFGALRSGAIGEGLVVTNVAGVAGSIAVRNLKVRFRPSFRIVADYGECIVTNSGEKGWVKIWDGVSLGDVTFGPALMGGASLDSKWNVASNYLRTAQTCTTQSFYQVKLKGSSNLHSLRFLMQEQFGSVYAKIASARYNSGNDYNPGDNVGTADYAVFVTNTVDGAYNAYWKDTQTKYRTVAICHLTADMRAKKRHSVTVGSDFNAGPSPVRLDNIKLAIAPGEGNEMSFGPVMHGCGAVGISSGTVTLTNSLPANIGLDVDSGTAKITSSMSVGGQVNVKEGAKLEFAIAKGGVRPVLSASSFSIEPGAQIVISAEKNLSEISKEGETFKIVTGCKFADYALDDVYVAVKGQYITSASLSVDEDGDIVATVKPRRGLIIIIK